MLVETTDKNWSEWQLVGDKLLNKEAKENGQKNGHEGFSGVARKSNG